LAIEKASIISENSQNLAGKLWMLRDKNEKLLLLEKELINEVSSV
jgi:hypothetical protein